MRRIGPVGWTGWPVGFRRAALAFAGLGLAMALGGAGRAQAPDRELMRLLPAPAERPDSLYFRPLSRVVIEGNHHTDTPLILRTAALEPGQRFTRDDMATAVRSLYGLGLFSSIEIRAWPDSGGADGLSIRVRENPRVTSIAWEGNKKISTEDLKGKIDLKSGQLLTPRKLFEARRAIEAAYADQGYASAQVESRMGEPQDGTVSLTFSVTEGRRVSIESVGFEGIEQLEDKDLKGVLKLKPNSLFRRKRYTAERMREDQGRLEEYYHNHGYKDATVLDALASFSGDRSSVRLTYRIQEGPLYEFGDVTWHGNVAVPTDALQAASSIIPGQPFSQAKVDATTSEAYSLYTEKGYLLQLQILPDLEVSGNDVRVSYSITEGEPSHVNEVSIVGNTRTKERVIRRELSLIPGQLMRRSALLRSQRDVMALGFFEDVGIDYVPSGVGTGVDVSFQVKEKSSGTASAGAGYSSSSGLTGFVEFGHNNLFGNGQSVSVHLERGGRRETFDVSFTEPWAFGTPTSVSVQLYNTQNEYDVYTERRRGGGVNVGRPWFFKHPDFSRVYAGYSLETLRYPSFGDLDLTNQSFLKASEGTSSNLTLSFVRNSTDNPFYPTSGSKTTIRLETAGGPLGGDLHYYKPLIDHRVYFVPFWKPAVMIRNRAGLLGSLRSGKAIPGSETYRLGGTRTDYLRGYPDYDIVPDDNIAVASDGRLVKFPGGRMAYTFTAEYQFPVVNPVHGLLFFDAGNTWNSSSEFSLNSLKKGVGVGIRLEIPMLGPVGFDYAYGIDRRGWEPHFIIGPAF